MTNEEKQELYTEVNELLDIYNEFSPCQPDGKSQIESVKPCITEMIDYIMKDATEAASMKDWLDRTATTQQEPSPLCSSCAYRSTS